MSIFIFWKGLRMGFLYLLRGRDVEGISILPQKNNEAEYFIRQDMDLKVFMLCHRVCYIYGAGKYAIELAKYFNVAGIRFSGFVVTDAQRNMRQLDGHPVYSLESLDLSDKSIGFFLGLGLENTKQVLRMLKAHNVDANNVFGKCLIPQIEEIESGFISFNVFDTLIGNTMAVGEGLFLLIQEQLQSFRGEPDFPDFIIDNFFVLRINAEKLARANYCVNGIQEITLQQIYEALGSTGCISKVCEKKLITLEENMVKENVYLIEKNIQLLQTLEETSIVLLVAETYYSRELINDIFNILCPALLEYELIITSECKMNKETTALYQGIHFYKNVQFAVWEHYGSDKLLDYEIPSSLGITAHLVADEALFPFEEKMIEENLNNITFQRYIGVSRKARRTFSQLDLKGKLGCAIGGPLFFPYVCWVLQRCEQKGIKRLYFIARDGFLLKQIADLIIKIENKDISTYYIYGSRKAWRMASLSERNCDLRKIIANSSEIQIRTVREIADILQIPMEILDKYVSPLYKEKGYLDIDEYDYVRHLILDNRELADELIRYHSDKRELLKEYFRQEIDFSDKNFAFVELSGSGFTQECIADVLSELTSFPVITFFQKLDWVCENKICINYGFMPSNIKDGFLIEVLCHALHGTTEGYQNTGSKIEPIIDCLEQNAIEEHGYEEFIEGTLLFVRMFMKTGGYKLAIENISVPIEYLQHIIEGSSNDILDFIGDMPFSYSGRDKEVKRFAPRLSMEDIEKIYRIRKREKKLIYLYRGYQFIENEPIERYYNGVSLDFSLLRSGERIKQYALKCAEESVGIGQYDFRFVKELFVHKKIVLIVSDDLNYNKKNDMIKNIGGGADIIAVIECDVESFGIDMKLQEIEFFQKQDYDNILFLTEKKESAFMMLEKFLEFGVNGNKLCWFCI